MKQLTLVAFHGAKQPGFAQRILATQQAVRSGLPAGTFSAYSVEQVHATLAGMERLDARTPPVGRNPWRARGAEVVLDFRRLREVVLRHLPLAIRCGGFDPASRAFTSRGEAPYTRAFQVRLATGRVILVGWPHASGDFGRRSLAALRDDLARTCGIEHKYEDDNDLFLVLGRLSADMERIAPASARVERAVRERLAADPLELELAERDIHVVCYEEESLEPGSTTAYALDDPRLTSEFLIGLYGP